MANVVLFAGRIFLVVFLFIFLFALIKTGGFTLGQRKKEYSFKSAKNELTMSRRTTELFLLFAALPIVVLLFAMLIFTQTDVEPSTMGVPLIIFALFLIAHFAVRNLAPKADQAILPIAFALTGIGMAFITRINTGYVTQQLVLLAFGIGVFIAVLVVVKSIDKFRRRSE